MRVTLVIVAAVVAVAGFLWLHMRYVIGAVPVMHDIPFVIFDASLPIFVLVLLVGAALLWTRTRHISALLQLIPCCILFVLAALDELRRFLDRADNSQLSDLMRQSATRVFVQITGLLCFVFFLVGYIWNARRPNRI